MKKIIKVAIILVIVVSACLFLLPIERPKSKASNVRKTETSLKNIAALIRCKQCSLILEIKDAWQNNVILDFENDTLTSLGKDGIESSDDIVIHISQD